MKSLVELCLLRDSNPTPRDPKSGALGLKSAILCASEVRLLIFKRFKYFPNCFPKPASVARVDAPSDWRPGRGFNQRRGRQHSFVEIDHEIFSTVILSLPLIQEGQLSVSAENMCTILVNRLEDWACPVNVWLGKLTELDMTPLGWLGRKTSTQTKTACV